MVPIFPYSSPSNLLMVIVKYHLKSNKKKLLRDILMFIFGRIFISYFVTSEKWYHNNGTEKFNIRYVGSVTKKTPLERYTVCAWKVMK